MNTIDLETIKDQIAIALYKPVLGQVTVKYVDIDTNLDISAPDIYSNLSLGINTYKSKAIDNYTASPYAIQSVDLNELNPYQTVTFFYKRLLGKVTIKHIDIDTGYILSNEENYSNLTLGTYSYAAKEINNYTIVGESMQSFNLSSKNLEEVIIFKYKKNVFYGNLKVLYRDISTNEEIMPPEIYPNLGFGEYSYTATEISNYELISNKTVTVNLDSLNSDVVIVFEYK